MVNTIIAQNEIQNKMKAAVSLKIEFQRTTIKSKKCYL